MRIFQKARLSFFLSVCALYSFAQDPTWFENATQSLGLTMATTFRLHVVDINNDDYPDFVVVKDGNGIANDPLRIYLNVKDTTSSNPSNRMFLDITPLSGINADDDSDTAHQVTTVVFGDINNDGNVDMATGNYYHRLESYTDVGDRCEAYLGDGTGRFTLVPNNGLHELGLINPGGMSFLDYDKDGKLDLFIAVWFEDYTNDIWNHGYLLKGNGDGTFTDVSAASGIGSVLSPMYGSVATDWNNDGWVDIATAPYCRDQGQLWKNNGDGTFSDVAVTANYNVTFMSGDGGQHLCMWGSMPEDFDNDGDMDFHFSLVHGGNGNNEGHSTTVVNSGASNNYHLDWDISRITWDNPKASHRGDYDATWFDMDNDGLEDLVQTQASYVTSPPPRLYMLKQNSLNKFDDVTGELGLVNATYQSTHVVEALDLELDGDDDLMIGSVQAGYPTLVLRNDVGNKNNWAAIKLVAPAGVNKNSIGAMIQLWSGGVARMREVRAGQGNQSGQQPFILLFGLGSSSVIDSVSVQWPGVDVQKTVVKNLFVNQMLTIGTYGIIADESMVSELSVYPNPAKDYVVVQTSKNAAQKIQTVEVYDLMGKRVNNLVVYKSTDELVFIHVENIGQGSYLVKVSNDSGYTAVKSFIKVQ